jgi:hypothetical protein
MTWTYTANPFQLLFVGPPYANAQQCRDTVRFLLGDTNTTDQQLQDSEVDGLVLLNTPVTSGVQVGFSNVFQAAVTGCVGLSAKYTRQANKSVGDVSIQFAAIAQSYRDLQPQICAIAARYDVPIPYAGGQSYADMETDRDDDDLPQPQFSIGMDDNIDGSTSDTLWGQGFSQVVPG